MYGLVHICIIVYIKYSSAYMIYTYTIYYKYYHMTHGFHIEVLQIFPTWEFQIFFQSFFLPAKKNSLLFHAWRIGFATCWCALLGPIHISGLLFYLWACFAYILCAKPTKWSSTLFTPCCLSISKPWRNWQFLNQWLPSSNRRNNRDMTYTQPYNFALNIVCM